MKKVSKILGLALLVSLVAAGCIKKSADDSVDIPTHIQQAVPPTATPSTTKTNVSYKGEAGKNALELLRASHQITTKTFSGVGEYIESINGVKPDSKHFWSFYVNGKSSNVGADQYTTTATDTIEWKLEEIK